MARESFYHTYSRLYIHIVSVLSLLLILNSGSLYSNSQPQRTVNINIAVESGLKAQYGCEKKIRRIIGNCSQIFQDRFGIRLKIKKIETWQCKDETKSMFESMNDLMSYVLPGGCDVVLGIIPQKNSKNSYHGLSSYFQGYMLISYLESEKAMKYCLLHELGHMFGAIDLQEAGSIMNINNPGFCFDEFSSEVILLNRDRSFHSDSFPLSEPKLDEAVSIFEQRAALNLGESGIHIFLAIFNLEKGNYDLAAQECNKSLELNPSQKDLHDILATAYLKQGKIDRAIEEYHKALEHLSNSPDIRFNLGVAYCKKGADDRAKSAFQQAVRYNPHHAKAHANLAYIYLKEDEIDKAIKECQIALKNFPESDKILCTSATALVLKYESFNRDKLFMNVKNLKKNVSSPEILSRGELLEKAKAQCRKAIEINPALPDAYNILGIAYAYQGNIEEAEVEFLNALELRSDDVHAHHNLGLLYFKNRSWEKSAYHIKRLIDIKVSVGLGYEILSGIFQNQSKYNVLLKSIE